MEKNILYNLYQKTSDEEVTPFDNDKGFTVISLYPENMWPKRRILVRVFFLDDTEDRIGANISMVGVPEDGKEEYPLVEPKKNVTNFMVGKKDDFVFNFSNNKIYKKDRDKEYTVVEFVDLLKKYHSIDTIFVERHKQRFLMFFLKFLLIGLFWLADLDYYKGNYFMMVRSRNYTRDIHFNNSKDFLFNYFKLSKNILIVLFFFYIAIILLAHSVIEDFVVPQITNSFLVAIVVFILFIAEKYNKKLQEEIQKFSRGEDSILKTIEKKRLGISRKINFDIE